VESEVSQASTTTSDVPQGVQEEVIDLDEHAEGRRARDDDDEAAEDDPEVLAGMMAGFKAVNGDASADDDQQTTITEGKKRFGGGSDKGDEDDGDDGEGSDVIAGADAANGDEPSPGANDDDNRLVPWVAVGPGIKRDYEIAGRNDLPPIEHPRNGSTSVPATINLYDTVPTVLRILGLPRSAMPSLSAHAKSVDEIFASP